MASEAFGGSEAKGGAAGGPRPPHGRLVLPEGRAREAVAFVAGAVAAALALLCSASILTPHARAQHRLPSLPLPLPRRVTC